MSNVVKLNIKSGKLNVKVKDNYEADGNVNDADEDYFHKQLQEHYEQGFNEGQKAAKAELEKEYNSKVTVKYAELEKVIRALQEKVLIYEEEFESIVINLGVGIAEKIVKREIMHESIFDNVLKEALKKVLGANNIIVKLNPSDISKLISENEKFFTDDSLSKIKFEEDDRIDAGGCLVETEIGNVDARISTQITEIKKQLDASILTHTT